MPMQPRPSAETSSLLFPSIRFCIGFSFGAPRGLGLVNSGPRSISIMLVGHRLQPLHIFTAGRAGDRDMAHGGGGRRAMPVFDARRGPDDIARFDLALWAPFFLHPSGTGGDDEHLPRGVRMPGGTGAGRKDELAARGAQALLGTKEGLHDHRPAEDSGWRRGCCSRTVRRELHVLRISGAAPSRGNRIAAVRSFFIVIDLADRGAAYRCTRARFSNTSFATGRAEKAFGQPE